MTILHEVYLLPLFTLSFFLFWFFWNCPASLELVLLTYKSNVWFKKHLSQVKGLDKVLRENDACGEVAGKANTAVILNQQEVHMPPWPERLRFALPDELDSQKQSSVGQFITYKWSSLIEDFHSIFVSFSEMRFTISKDFSEDQWYHRNRNTHSTQVTTHSGSQRLGANEYVPWAHLLYCWTDSASGSVLSRVEPSFVKYITTRALCSDNVLL